MLPRPLLVAGLVALVGAALVVTRRSGHEPVTPAGAPADPVAADRDSGPSTRPGVPAPAIVRNGRRGGLDVVCGPAVGRPAASAAHGFPGTTRGPDGRPLPPPRPPPFPGLRTPHPVVEESLRLNHRDTPPREDLQIVQVLLEAYGRALGAHPAGDNADILAALTGRNALGLVFIPPDHPALASDGRLLDRWGTPVFFDSVSRQETRLRSAGPDRTLWTGDDLMGD